MTSDEYQLNFTENPVAKKLLYDVKSRTKKAQMIHSVIEDHVGNTESLHLLDMSCSNGLMTKCLAEKFGSVTGIDIDEGALVHAREENARSNISYENMDGLHTTFEDNTFDVALCNQMYEHVPDPFQLMSEIHRVLKPGGICYFGATSRLIVIEPHYGKIPFLSYLPKPLANRYLKLLGKGDKYYETLFTYWGLKKLVSSFNTVDYTLKVVRDPVKFNLKNSESSILNSKITHRIAKFLFPVLPGYIWILEKS